MAKLLLYKAWYFAWDNVQNYQVVFFNKIKNKTFYNFKMYRKVLL